MKYNKSKIFHVILVRNLYYNAIFRILTFSSAMTTAIAIVYQQFISFFVK